MLGKKDMGNKCNPINLFFEIFDYATWFEIEKSHKTKMNVLIHLTLHY